MKQNKQAFTLVELIVVITILAILGTIAFISLQGYSASSRDSVRISDVSNMKTSLELFHLDAGKYPLPDNSEEITYGGDILWYQGILGQTVLSQLSRNLNEIPTDPLTDKEYIFSTSGNRNEFQILNLLEGDLALTTINQTNAATSIRTPRVDGQYNGLFIKTPNYIFPTPSLITSEPIVPTVGLLLNDTNIKSQIITGGKNIPNTGNINSSTGKLNIKLSVYSGAIITSLSPDSDKIFAMQAIQGAYSGSELATSDIYSLILNTAENDLPKLVDTVVLNKTSSSSIVIIPDTEAPVGGDFIIDEGTTTNSTTINLTITCPEETGVEMYISGDITETPTWEECTTTKSFTLTTGDGSKSISMKFRDSLGNESDIVSNVIDYVSVLYSFTSFTFTNCGQSGKTGPNISSCKSSYSTTWDEDNNFFTQGTYNGYQLWTVPSTGTYTIITAGAEGAGGCYNCGSNTLLNNTWRNGGKGVIMQGNFDLIKGEKIQILVGQKGSKEGIDGGTYSHQPGGGGGGTFVISENGTKLIIAGGGGGGGNGNYGQESGDNGSIGNTGTNGGGSNGAGGGSSSYNDGGAGFSTNGGIYNGQIPYSFLNGGTGGAIDSWAVNSHGGFGGGGGAGLLPGAGGGYSGGGTSGAWSSSGKAGGGGSYNLGTNQVNGDLNSGHGYVTITKL